LKSRLLSGNNDHRWILVYDGFDANDPTQTSARRLCCDAQSIAIGVIGYGHREGRPVRRREFITAVAGAVVAGAVAARAQQGTTKRIGVLMPESEGNSDSKARVVVFETTFKQLGWVPGRNLQIDYRWAMGDIQKMRLLATDLVNSATDALVAVSTPALAAIQKATHTIPIVFVAVSEPVINGFVPSLAHPGGNATGFSNLEPSIGGKLLEILKGIAPRISHVSVMFNLTTGITTDLFFRAVEAASPRFAVETVKSKFIR
jgi:putative ABC transport system substrate-binding protein